MLNHDWVFMHTAKIPPEEELLLISGMLPIIEITVPGYALNEMYREMENIV